MGLSDIADDILSGLSRLGRGVLSPFEPTLRLGVTGLSGAGKTVFITGLVASLLHRSRLHRFGPEAEGRLRAVVQEPQPDPQIPRFAYEAHRDALVTEPRQWPTSTRSVAQLRLALRYRPTGLAGGLAGDTTLNLDIVDYPGEWLLDLPLIDKGFDAWTAEALAAAESPARRPHAEAWHRALGHADPAGPADPQAAEALADAYRAYLKACRAAGLSALAPGRFLMPGEMAGSPALTFAPIPRPEGATKGTLFALMKDRYRAYRQVVAKPFFETHFAQLDRQVVLIDALQALADGPRALSDLTATLGETLASFRHGRRGWLDRIVGARRIDRLLVVASKADHVHHEQHGRLTGLVRAMLAEAASRAEFGGARIEGLSVAAIRATAEQETERGGERLGLVRGRRAPDGAEVAIFPGDLPADPARLLSLARAAAPGEAPPSWPDAGFANLTFLPPAWGPDGAPPHIRLDAALDFLLGDRLA